MNVYDETKKHLESIVDQWCAKQFNHEHFMVRLMRATLEMNAYIEDRKRVDNGQLPIRPLDSYPTQP